MDADNFTSDSTAVTGEVAEGDSCFVSIRMACVPGSCFSSVMSVDLVRDVVCPHKPCLL